MKEKTNKKTEFTSLREKAEILAADKSGISIPFTEADILKLIHELEVHQIELELQNEELKLAKERAISSALEKYADLYDFAPSGYFTLSKEDVILDLNLYAAKMIGKDRAQLKGIQFSSFVCNDSKNNFQNFLKDVFNSFTKKTCEVKLISFDRIQMFVFLSGIATEERSQCLVTAIDITERKESEFLLLQKNMEIEAKNAQYAQLYKTLQNTNNELIIAKERAEESDQLKTAFLHNMSHEIRSPMNAIMGFAGLIAKNYNNRSKLEKYADIIYNRCLDLLDIINDILDIAKIESGNLTINLEACDVKGLFEELKIQMTDYQQRTNKTQIQFNILSCFDNSEIYILTDKGKLKQILINLITNAFKFTLEGKIDCFCKIEQDKLVFYVQDTGIGIPSDQQKYIYERFARLNLGSNQAVGGTGLGLPISKGLVNILGGEMFLQSESGKGSMFYFTIPYNTASISLNEMDVEGRHKEYYFSLKTVLIVEDDFYNIEFLKEILSETGLNILICKSGKEAMNISLNKNVDLVLMNISLPDMNGFEAVRQILRLKSDLKIIAQTAYAGGEDKRQALEAGCIDFISKPLNSELLLSLLNKYLT